MKHLVNHLPIPKLKINKRAEKEVMLERERESEEDAQRVRDGERRRQVEDD